MLRIFHLWTFQIPGSPAVNFLIVVLVIAMYFVAGRFLLRWRADRRPELESTVLHQHPALSGCAVLLLAVLLTSAWVLPNDRYYAGSKLQRRQGVRPSQLAMLAIQADPVQVFWIGNGAPPPGLVNTRLVYLGRADGVRVLYSPPDWTTCDVDACRGVVWRVNEADAVVRVEVDPPDRQAPRVSRPGH